jgi:hypothetical protein
MNRPRTLTVSMLIAMHAEWREADVNHYARGRADGR